MTTLYPKSFLVKRTSQPMEEHHPRKGHDRHDRQGRAVERLGLCPPPTELAPAAGSACAEAPAGDVVCSSPIEQTVCPGGQYWGSVPLDIAQNAPSDFWLWVGATAILAGIEMDLAFVGDGAFYIWTRSPGAKPGSLPTERR